ncbi:RING finger and SPRY domain-containing protein 1 [Actinomortierella wolfii]|nr:RING finger and SPRY domain-containing protein 1 [Actinomortierella wolfii]
MNRIAGRLWVKVFVKAHIRAVWNKLNNMTDYDDPSSAFESLIRLTSSGRCKVQIMQKPIQTILKEVASMSTFGLTDQEEVAGIRQAKFCAEWALRRVFYDLPAVVMLNITEASRHWKISEDGLMVRNDGSSFESIRATVSVTCGKWYYEVTVLTSGIMQIGWATPHCRFCPDEGTGVGDDLYGFSYDGCRNLLWSNGESTHYGEACAWRPGDVLGFYLDVDNAQLECFINGTSLGTMTPFASIGHFQEQAAIGFFPAFSITPLQQIELNFGASPFRYPPARPWRNLNDHGELTTELRELITKHCAEDLATKLHLDPETGLRVAIVTDQEIDYSSLCSICCDHSATITLQPCGHDGFCVQCAYALDACPMCRSRIFQRQMIPWPSESNEASGSNSSGSRVESGSTSETSGLCISGVSESFSAPVLNAQGDIVCSESSLQVPGDRLLTAADAAAHRLTQRRRSASISIGGPSFHEYDMQGRIDESLSQGPSLSPLLSSSASQVLFHALAIEEYPTDDGNEDGIVGRIGNMDLAEDTNHPDDASPRSLSSLDSFGSGREASLNEVMERVVPDFPDASALSSHQNSISANMSNLGVGPALVSGVGNPPGGHSNNSIVSSGMPPNPLQDALPLPSPTQRAIPPLMPSQHALNALAPSSSSSSSASLSFLAGHHHHHHHLHQVDNSEPVSSAISRRSSLADDMRLLLQQQGILPLQPPQSPMIDSTTIMHLQGGGSRARGAAHAAPSFDPSNPSSIASGGRVAEVTREVWAEQMSLGDSGTRSDSLSPLPTSVSFASSTLSGAAAGLNARPNGRRASLPANRLEM